MKMRDIKPGQIFSNGEDIFIKTATKNESYAMNLRTSELIMFFQEELSVYPGSALLILRCKSDYEKSLEVVYQN